MKRLSKDQIRILHSKLIEQTGGTDGGLEYEGMLKWVLEHQE